MANCIDSEAGGSSPVAALVIPVPVSDQRRHQQSYDQAYQQPDRDSFDETPGQQADYDSCYNSDIPSSVHSFGLKSFFMVQCDDIGQQAVCSRHSGRQLPEEYEAGIYEFSLSVAGNQQASLLLFAFARIMHREDRFIFRIRLAAKVNTSLLDPSFEILLRDLIRKIQYRVIRHQEI